MRVRTLSVVATAMLAAVVAQAEPYDEIVGLNAPAGGALLVKRVSVPAGASIVGAEIVTNDLRTTFPRVTLYKGHVRKLADATMVREFTAVRATTRHVLTLSCQPIEVPTATEFYLAVAWPSGDGLRGYGDGAAIPAVLRDEAGDSYVASGRDKDLQRIEGLELGLRLVLRGAAAKSDADPGENPLEQRVWRTHFDVEQQLGDGTTVLRFGVESKAIVRVTMYDVMGRKIKELVGQEFAPGEYSTSWDGKSMTGTNVASGIYLAKGVVGGQTFTRKVVVAR